MGPVLVEDVVDVDKQRSQILNLAFCVGGVPRQRAGELEEVEEQRLDELLEFECAVVVLCVLRVGEACGRQVGDALFFEGGQFIVQLQGGPVSARRSMRRWHLPYHVLVAKDSPSSVRWLWGRL